MRTIIVLISLLVAAIGADARSLSFRHYTSDNGLPSNTVRGVMQDSLGFMWFSTDGGLVRFDGRQVRRIPLRNPDGSLTSDYFVGRTVMSHGKLWGISDNTILCYDPTTERLAFVEPVYTGSTARRLGSALRDIAVDRDGFLWVAASHTGVFKIDPATLETRHYDVPELSNTAGVIFIDSRNDVWLANNQSNGTLMKLDRSSDAFRPYAVTIAGEPVKIRSLALADDNAYGIWAGLWTDGLIKFDPSTGQAEKFLDARPTTGLLRVHSISPLADNTIMIGSDVGLTIFDPSNGSVERALPNELDRGSISDRFVYPIIADREGGVWIGTFYGGVNYLGPDLKQFETFRHSRFVNSVSGNIISAFCEDSDGNIWIASDDGGLSRMAPDGTFVRHSFADGSRDTPAINVHSLAIDGDDLWVGTYSTGVWVYNIRSGQTRHYMPSPGVPGSLDDSSSYAVFRDLRGNIWVATMTGIFIYLPSTDNFELVRDLGVMTIDIDQNADGDLWFATQGQGIFRFDPFHGSWKNYRTATSSLPSDFVNALLIDSGGAMWAGTSRGMVVYDSAADDFLPVEPDRIPGNVFWIGEGDDSLWLTSDIGLVNYIPSSRSGNIYTVHDGLLSSQFSPNAGLRASDGRIFIGSVRGFNAFYPHRIRPNTAKPRVAFTGLDVVNSRVEVGDPRLPADLNTVPRLELSHDDYLFSIGFASLSYANPWQNRYAYKLEGFDKDWIDAGMTNRATYTNLQPGDYTLLVRASNNDALWTDTELRLPIHVSPPWYLSWPMKTVYLLLVLGTILMAFRLQRRYYARRQQEELAKVSAAAERKLFHARLSFFTMIAHEIRTPVSLIIGPLEQILHSPGSLSPAQRDDLEVVSRNSHRLLDLVDQLLDFKKVEQEGLQISLRMTDLAAVLRAVAERFAPAFRHQGLELRVELPGHPVDALVDPEAVTKMVSNLLANARKFAATAATLSMTVGPDGDEATITVSDDGCGIPPEAMPRIFNPFYQVDSPDHKHQGGTGIGLSIVKTTIEAHGGTIRVDSAPSRGTSFIVTLPLAAQPTTNDQRPTPPAPGPTPPAARQDERRGATASPLPPACTHPGPTTDDQRPMSALVVDDNDDMLRFVSGHLSSSYRVATATDGREALDILRREPVDLIISDWMMPGLSGVELCIAVRRDPALSHIPFILLTAKTDDYSKIEGLNCGADAYVAKPFSISVLEARIRSMLRIRQLLREKFSNSPLEPITSVASNPTDSDFLDRLTAEIEARFADPELSVDRLAQAMGISRSSLYSKIKTLIDVTPNELIQLTRLKRAAVLLREGTYRVNEVAYMVGFSNPSYFAKCFQKQFGIRPGEMVDGR